jgi:hypothetical protein
MRTSGKSTTTRFGFASVEIWNSVGFSRPMTKRVRVLSGRTAGSGAVADLAAPSVGGVTAITFTAFEGAAGADAAGPIGGVDEPADGAATAAGFCNCAANVCAVAVWLDTRALVANRIRPSAGAPRNAPELPNDLIVMLFLTPLRPRLEPTATLSSHQPATLRRCPQIVAICRPRLGEAEKSDK